MNENNGFILKPEMYNQEEWCKMFMKSIETINNLQSKIDKAIEYLEEKYSSYAEEDEMQKDELLDILKEDK